MIYHFEVPDDVRLISLAPHYKGGFFCYIGEVNGPYLQGRPGKTQQEAVDNAVRAVREALNRFAEQKAALTQYDITKNSVALDDIPLNLADLGL